MKKCSTCNDIKEDTEFNKAKDKLRSNCKSCQKAYRLKNREAINEYNRIKAKESYDKNPEHYRAKQKEYYQDNKLYYKEYNSKYGKEYYQNNKESLLENMRLYREQNKEAIAKNNRKWQVENPGKIAKTSSKRRAKKLALEENFTDLDREYIFNVFNSSCFNCGSTDSLQVDHNKPLSKGYILELGNAVLLCKSCNCSKGASLPEEFYSEAKLEELAAIFAAVKEEY